VKKLTNIFPLTYDKNFHFYYYIFADLPLLLAVKLSRSHTIILFNSVEDRHIYDLKTSKYSRSRVLNSSFIFEEKQIAENITLICPDHNLTSGRLSIIIELEKTFSTSCQPMIMLDNMFINAKYNFFVHKPK